MNTFVEAIEKRSKEINSRLILALDLSTEMTQDKETWSDKKRKLTQQAVKILEETGSELAGVKFNHQMVLPLGIFSKEFGEVLDAANENGHLPKIMDCKANDVGHTNTWIANHYFDVGFDAIIANPLVGYEGGIDKIEDVVKKRDKALILLCVMSHPGSNFTFTREVLEQKKPVLTYQLIAQNAASWGASGLIVGGTYPELVQKIRNLIPPDMLIISPGLGAQGGKGKGLRKAGTDYFIVGRSIFESKTPLESAIHYRILSVEK